MSKHCAICNSKINFISEYKLSNDIPKAKICFDCYQYVSTALKGDPRAIDIIKNKYTSSTSREASGYIKTIQNQMKSQTKATPRTQTADGFIDLVSNTPISDAPSTKQKTQHAVIYIDKLTQEKITRLQRTKIIANLCFFALSLFVPLFSFYIYISTTSALNAIAFAVSGVFIIILFGCVRQVIDTILDEK